MPELLTHVASPLWAYLVLLGLLAVDAFVPVIPTQLVMITSGALTVYGGLSLPLTIGVGALGVFAGDLACYLLGRSAPGRPAPGASPAGPTRRAGHRAGLRRPGPVVILLCRFVPGGRMAACFSAGRSRYPYRLFLAYEALAAMGWATYGALVGHLGGTALAVGLVAGAGRGRRPASRPGGWAALGDRRRPVAGPRDWPAREHPARQPPATPAPRHGAPGSDPGHHLDRVAAATSPTCRHRLTGRGDTGAAAAKRGAMSGGP